MFECDICRKKIDIKKINRVSHFTLGNMRLNKFYGEQTIYFHVNCLKESYKSTAIVSPT